jgi:hypothetical protein
MHKFILGENPQAPETGGLWIIHLPNPIAIIECVLKGEKIHSKKAIHVTNLMYTNSDGYTEYWQLRLYHLFTTDFEMLDDKLAADFVNDVLTKALFWYESYLKWEDGNIDMDEIINQN